jgi:hypothetical protein
MIEHYIASSRRTRPPTAELTAAYKAYYEQIVALTVPLGPPPELFITYSSDRTCELIRFAKSTYLVYDQYLGQSFNRLNRIQYALHGTQMLSQGYACKYVAERLICLGQTGPAAFFAMVASQFEQNVKAEGDPFRLPKKDDDAWVGFTGTQELFVMAHELAHHRWHLDRDNLSAEISHYIVEFLDLKTKTADEDFGNLAENYKEALDKAPAGFLEEVFADDFGALIAFRASITVDVPVWQRAAGIILAFKYLRLFRHLDLLARRMAELSAETDQKSFKCKMEALKHDIWDGLAGNIRLYQFREHFIRHRLRIACGRIPSYVPSDEAKISALIGEYDENTEFPVLFGLVDRLSDSLTPGILADLCKTMGAHHDGVALIDKMTGWSR